MDRHYGQREIQEEEQIRRRRNAGGGPAQFADYLLALKQEPFTP